MKYLLAILALFLPLIAWAAVLITPQGGTGTGVVPTAGQVLVGQAGGTYAPQATSTLNIQGLFATSSANFWLSTKSTTDVAEGSNLYFTNARVLTYLDTLSKGYFFSTSSADTWLTTKSTTNITEGTNLYYTDERNDDRTAALLQQGSNITLTYNDAGNSLTVSASGGGLATTSIDTSAELAAILSDEDGSGRVVYDTGAVLASTTIASTTLTASTTFENATGSTIFTAIASSTRGFFGDLLVTNGTTTNWFATIASSTSAFAQNLLVRHATSSTLYAGTFDGAGLADCDAADNALTWNISTKLFGCNTIISSGGGGSDGNWIRNVVSGFLRYATITDDVVFGSTATSTAPLFFDVSDSRLNLGLGLEDTAAFISASSSRFASTTLTASTTLANATSSHFAITGLATANGAYLAVNPSGTVIATTTPTGGGGGITSLGGQTGSSQTFATTSSNGGWGFSSGSNIHTLNIPTASALNSLGLLAASDFLLFGNRLGTTSIDSMTELEAITGTNIYSTADGALTSDDLTNNQIDDLSDVGALSETTGDLLSWNGSAWTDVATSTLGFISQSFFNLFNEKISSTSLSWTDSSQIDGTYTPGTGVFTASIVADSIGDTQLAFNTGQNLTTTSDVQFAEATTTQSFATVASSSLLFAGDATTTRLYSSSASTTLLSIFGLRDASNRLGTNGQVLQTNGTAAYWVSTSTLGLGAGGGGGVTSVDMTVPTGLSISGNPITLAGTLALSFTPGYSIPLTASTTEGSKAYASTTALSVSDSSTLDLTYTPTTGVFTGSVVGDSITDTELAFNTGQNLTTSSGVTFSTVDTGQGANELFDMDQNVLTTSDVTFSEATTTGFFATVASSTRAFFGSATTTQSFSSIASSTNLFSSIGTFFDMLRIPFGTAPVVDAAGEIALDTSDDQLIVADSAGTARVFATDEKKVKDMTIASTSVAFVSGGVLPVGSYKDGLELTQYRCYVSGGTSVVLNLSDGTNDTETITCNTTVSSDTDVATNDTFTADEIMNLEFGTITGTVNYVHFEAYARITRE